MYRIVYRKEAARALLKMPRNTALLIREKLEGLAQDPTGSNPNVKPLQGEHAFRLRVGNWRVIYELQRGELIVLVLRIGARGGVYR
ncbi:MAG: type II toxin-antitoxin system RelE/ParE family toxin [Nitrospirae bacterium]|nr:type II toxin-antitoxin system RelE/ParE family toxin [Nitrospirota bacterium]